MKVVVSILAQFAFAMDPGSGSSAVAADSGGGMNCTNKIIFINMNAANIQMNMGDFRGSCNGANAASGPPANPPKPEQCPEKGSLVAWNTKKVSKIVFDNGDRVWFKVGFTPRKCYKKTVFERSTLQIKNGLALT